MNLDLSSALRTPEAAWISRVRLTSVRSLNFDGLPQLDLGQIFIRTYSQCQRRRHAGTQLPVSWRAIKATPRSTRRRIIPITGGFRLLHQFHGSTGNPAAPHPDHHCRRRRCFHYTEQIQELIQRIFKGYQAYRSRCVYTDPEQFDAYLAEYLQTEEAVQIIND